WAGFKHSPRTFGKCGAIGAGVNGCRFPRSYSVHRVAPAAMAGYKRPTRYLHQHGFDDLPPLAGPVPRTSENPAALGDRCCGRARLRGGLYLGRAVRTRSRLSERTRIPRETSGRSQRPTGKPEPEPGAATADG